MSIPETTEPFSIGLTKRLYKSQITKRLIIHAKRLARHYGIEIKRYIAPTEEKFSNWMYYSNLLESAWRSNAAAAGNELDARFVDYCIANHQRSKSQIFQDLLVLFLLGEKEGGFFVEFGAANGISLSNSFLLERSFGWRGILAEPARIWHKALAENRGCAIDRRCVWSRSGETLEFNETDNSELSTLNQYSMRDNHSKARRLGHSYSVETVSLCDLLKDHGAPPVIDYLSVDTEGSEYEILSNFDFSAYAVSLITVEHNYASPDRENIAKLLTENGFERIFASYSLFDDWYVHASLLEDRAAT